MEEQRAIVSVLAATATDQKALFLRLVLQLHMNFLAGRSAFEIELFGAGGVPVQAFISQPTELADLLKTLFSARLATMNVEVLVCNVADEGGEGLGLMLFVEGMPRMKLGGTEIGGLFMRQLASDERGRLSSETQLFKPRPVEGWSR